MCQFYTIFKVGSIDKIILDGLCRLYWFLNESRRELSIVDNVIYMRYKIEERSRSKALDEYVKYCMRLRVRNRNIDKYVEDIEKYLENIEYVADLLIFEKTVPPRWLE